MPDRVILSSTTDTPEQVAAALGVEVPASEPMTEGAAPVTPPKRGGADPATVETGPDATPAPKPAATEPAAAAPASTTTAPVKKKKPNPHIARLLNEKQTLSERLAATEAENARLKAGATAPATAVTATTEPAAAAPTTTAPAAAELKEPVEDDFATFAEYQKAIRVYDREITRRELTQDVDRRISEVRQTERVQTEQHTRAQTYEERRGAAKERLEDFDDVIAPVANVKLTPAIHARILDSEVGPELQYHLAKHPAEFDRISRLAPGMQFVELGRLEARLEDERGDAGTVRPEARTSGAPVSTERVSVAVGGATPVSRAPAPVTGVGSGSVVPPADPSKMTSQEYKAWYRKTYGPR